VHVTLNPTYVPDVNNDVWDEAEKRYLFQDIGMDGKLLAQAYTFDELVRRMDKQKANK